MPCLSISRAASQRLLLARSVLATKPRSRSYSNQSRSAFISQCIKTLDQQTRDPLWRLLSVLDENPQTRETMLERALQDAAVPLADYRRYEQRLTLPMRGDTTNLAESSSLLDTLPLWAFLALFIRYSRLQYPYANVHTLMHTLDPLLVQVQSLPPDKQAPLLILAATHLSSANLLLPLDRIVRTFLSLPHPISAPVFENEGGAVSRVLTLDNDGTSELYINLFLRALAFTPHFTTTYSNHIISTIRLLNSLSPTYTIHPDTLTCLLTSTRSAFSLKSKRPQPLLSPRLAMFLQDQMHERTTPTHLLALLRFWSKERTRNPNPDSRAARTARRFVQQTWAELQNRGMAVTDAKGGQVPEIGSQEYEEVVKPVLHGNTLLLGAQGSVMGVKRVLKGFDVSRRVATEKGGTERVEGAVGLEIEAIKQAEGRESSASKAEQEMPSNAASQPGHNVSTTESLSSPGSNAEPEQSEPHLRRPLVKASLDVYDFTATLQSAVNSRNVSAKALLGMVERYASQHTGAGEKIPVQVHTLLLRGLMHRGEWEMARSYWRKKFMGRGEEGKSPRLDTMSLTTGVQILTRCGRVNEAFELLERAASKPTTLSSPATIPSSDPSPPALAPPTIHPVSLSPIALTEWMVALKRVGRPEVNFALWDYSYALYGVLHTGEMFDVMLQSAREAAVMDARRIGTQLRNYWELGRARLRLKATEGNRGKGGGTVLKIGEELRRGAVERMLELVGSDEPIPYKGGLWRGKRPEDTARDIFLQVMFGMDAERGTDGLRSVVTPARSVREDWDSDAGLVGLGVGLAELRMKKFEYQPGEDMFAPGGRSLYPHLVLTNTSFLNYLQLLSVTGRTGEVALTMAWMRELGLQPSKSTLALAMALWGEVSVEAPLVDVVSRPRGKWDGRKRKPRDEYERFVWWMEEWVGEWRMPAEEEVRKWRGIVKRMREAGSGPRTG